MRKKVDRRFQLHPDIRALLQKYPDGLTTRALMNAIPRAAHLDSIRKALKNMIDAYIDRWEPQRSGGYEAVWCVVNVPEHCPKPNAGNAGCASIPLD